MKSDGCIQITKKIQQFKKVFVKQLNWTRNTNTKAKKYPMHPMFVLIADYLVHTRKKKEKQNSGPTTTAHRI